MFSPWSCCMVFILPFFLDSFLDMSLRRNNIIFSPLVQFFPTCDRKTCRKINGGKKNGIFSHFHIFPHGPCCLWFPFSDSYVTEVHENDIYPWLKCTFFCLYFVMNNPDNCSFNHFFFSSILLPSALLSLSTFRGGLDFFWPQNDPRYRSCHLNGQKSLSPL